MKNKMKPLFIRIPVEWDEKTKEIARDQCRTQASVIRYAIRLYLENLEHEERKEKKHD